MREQFKKELHHHLIDTESVVALPIYRHSTTTKVHRRRSAGLIGLEVLLRVGRIRYLGIGVVEPGSVVYHRGRILVVDERLRWPRVTVRLKEEKEG